MAVFACSDLHGNGKLWDQIKEFLQPEDTLYILGDAADRGPDGWRILNEAFEDPRVIYIIGNHDDMLADRIAYPHNYEIVNHHMSNGGEPTWDTIRQEYENGNAQKVKDIMFKIRKLPWFAEYTNTQGQLIFMSHSGSTNKNNLDDLIWDRHEYLTKDAPEGIDVVVHGHTPIPLLIDDFAKWNHRLRKQSDEFKYPTPTEIEAGAFWYSNSKCDIDCGAIFTGITVLLNLDTFDEKIFIIE